ncbi:NAD(P)-dependent dehydrogenase (short-subunit alcohol dehydrogenase family) [Paenarthrobacter nicotinovorans]|uniref:SDR family NAD(P)-dependent oxidoreductase n=1 Tax=Micrococcaceae TaxID=1268 RepID=UPI000876080D|nr:MULTISPECIES: SDR family NAD(P)-dependent oxidoreductase [Micrococcaceae]MDR6438680.1 NAD(P)-dependent dehydrogenase (short-subunit alcohol dehydrogenase family) [Paenarthrobacter nicotinovorans]SCZ56566.1 NAD(P)-dependent dehydrogenase, short-chain alcohol dehydrogenase family [Arthrobacter sp. UNCCL28]
MTLDTTSLTRRALLLSGAALGAGILAGCTSALRQDSSSPVPMGSASNPAETPINGVRAQGDRYGVGLYNTQQVADELVWIDQNVQPLKGGEQKRVLITGSTAGAGQLAAAYLLKRGHTVVAHARNKQRAADVRRDLPGLEDVVVGDLLDLEQTRALAGHINALGGFDAIIHNAGEYGLSDRELLNSNSLSPYLLTALVTPPQQLSYLSSDLHLGGSLKLNEVRSGNGIGYGDSKLHMAMIAMAAARVWPDRQVNAVAPGWIPTLMGFHNGNTSTPDSLRDGYMTQVWLAEGIEPGSDVTGGFLFHQQVETRVNELVHDTQAQGQLLAAYAERTGVAFPA